MLQIYDQLHQNGIHPDLQKRVLEEARWGLDWLLKTRFGDGFRITWARMRYYTDNKVGTIDDVIVPAQNIAYENFLFSAVAAYASRVLKIVDPQRAAASLKENFAAGEHAVMRGGAAQGAASATATSGGSGGGSDGPPAWAQRMKRSQTINRGVTAADHVIRSGDRPSGSSQVDLSEGE